MQNNYFHVTTATPHHLSVGAMVINNQGQVYCHHFPYSDYYIFMCKTLLPQESPEQTLKRGLIEGMGTTVQVITYLGSLCNTYYKQGQSVNKTTLYFLCLCLTTNNNRCNLNDPEGDSALKWCDPRILSAKMKAQAKRLNRTTLNESEIIKRSLDYLKQHPIKSSVK